MELDVNTFIEEIRLVESLPNMCICLEALNQFVAFHQPIPKINFGYNYWSYLLGKVWVDNHYDEFVDNNAITLSMLKTITNVNGTEKIILSKEQLDIYNGFKKMVSERLHIQQNILNRFSVLH